MDCRKGRALLLEGLNLLLRYKTVIDDVLFLRQDCVCMTLVIYLSIERANHFSNSVDVAKGILSHISVDTRKV